MGTSALACLGVMSKGMTARIICAVLNPTPPAAHVPPLPPLVVVPKELYDDFDLVEWAIFYRVLW